MTMRECPTDDELQSVLQQSLAPGMLQRLESHLAECELCQQRMDELTSATDLIAAAPDMSSIPDVVLTQLHETPRAHLSSTAPEQSASRAIDDLPPVIAGFDIHEHIASGASGALYCATDLELGRRVAVKVMHAHVARSESARQRLQREARAIAAVNHPHVVAVYSTGEDNQRRPFMVMELITGQSFADHIENEGPLSAKTAAELVMQAARGLGAAHEQGLIHRDVKSSNILIEHSTQLTKVVDFGLVREDDQETRLTMDGMLAGTPAYISPEQIVDPTTVDARTDIYSLGIVLYEMLTGTVPFRGVVRMTLQQVQHAEPQPLRELNDAISRDLQTICLKAIQKDPDRRYKTADAFGDDLQRYLDNQPIVARPISQFEKVWRWCQRNRRVALLSALVGFAVISTIGVTAASAYRLSLANQEVRDADSAARMSAGALVEQRDAAMETVRKLVFEVPPMLQELRDDTSEVEKSILKIALEGLDRVGRSAELSGDVDFSTATALQQLGYALYVAGEFEDAEIQLERSLSLIQQMKENDQPVAVTAALQVEVCLTLADIDLALGKIDDEQRHRQAAIETAREWQSGHQDETDAVIALARSLRLMAELLTDKTETASAQQAFQESSELLEDALKRRPDDEEILMELDETLDSTESYVAQVRDPETDRLKRILQTELKAAEREHTADPDDQAARVALISALLRFAKWHNAFGNPGRSQSLCERAEELFKATADGSPVVELQIQHQLGDSYLADDFTRLARTTFRDAVKRGDALLATDHDNGALRDLIARCQLGLGDAFSQQGNGRKAQPYYDQVIDKYEMITQPTPDQQRLLLDAKIGLAWAAYCEDNNQKATDLLATYEQELQQAKAEWSAESPESSPWQKAWLDKSDIDLQDLRDALSEEAIQ